MVVMRGPDATALCLLYTNGNGRRVMILFTAEKGHKNTIVGYKQNSYIAYNLIA
jgi:hypothetical protein